MLLPGVRNCSGEGLVEEITLRVAYPDGWGKLSLLSESGTVVALLTSAASAPLHPSHASAGILNTKSFPIWRVLTTTNVEIVTPGHRVPDHRLLPISVAQHAKAFCQLFRGFSACAVLVCTTKVLRWGLGGYVLPGFAFLWSRRGSFSWGLVTMSTRTSTPQDTTGFGLHWFHW